MICVSSWKAWDHLRIVSQSLETNCCWLGELNWGSITSAVYYASDQMDPASGTPVAKLKSLPEQLYLTNSEYRDEDYDSMEFSSEFSRSFSSTAAAATASHHAGHGGFGVAHHQAVVSSTGRRYYLSTKRSGGSLGEVLAAIPFNWEEAPGRPKASRSRKGSRGSAGGGAMDQFFDNCGQNQQYPPRPKPARTRPPLHSRRQSSVSFHLNARLQAEQLLATPPPGASSLEYNSKGAAAADLLKDPVLPLPPRLRLGTARLMAAAADSSQDQFQHRYDTFLGVEELLPHGPRVDHRRTQSTMAYPTNRGHRRAWSLSYPAIEQLAEPRSSKEAAISSGRDEDFESTRASVAAAVGGDGSKDFWPSLKEKMRWRNAKLAGITVHRYLAKRLPQSGRGNKNNNNKGDDKNNKNYNWPGYFHILESSPQHRSSRFSDEVEKKNVDHGRGAAARGGRGGLPISRRNRSFPTLMIPLSRKPKSSSSSQCSFWFSFLDCKKYFFTT